MSWPEFPDSMDIDLVRADTMSPLPTETKPHVESDMTNESFELYIPGSLTQEDVEADPQLKLLQHDLLVLTSFPDNTALHWRPSWFPRPFPGKFWSLHSPPDVVSEFIHGSAKLGIMTRRHRRISDPHPLYIRDWKQWRNYCLQQHLPGDFLGLKHIDLLKLGLEQSLSSLQKAKIHPLYPEPYARGSGRYLLHPDYLRNLPKKFQVLGKSEVLVVYSSGTLRVETKDYYYGYHSQMLRVDGTGERVVDENYDASQRLKFEGAGRRWCHLPWTQEQEESCRPMKLLLKGLSPPGKKQAQNVEEMPSVAYGGSVISEGTTTSDIPPAQDFNPSSPFGESRYSAEDTSSVAYGSSVANEDATSFGASPAQDLNFSIYLEVTTPEGIIVVDKSPAVLYQPDPTKYVYHDQDGNEVRWPAVSTMDWSDPNQVSQLNEWRDQGYKANYPAEVKVTRKVYSGEEERFIAEWLQNNEGSTDKDRLFSEFSQRFTDTFRDKNAVYKKAQALLKKQKQQVKREKARLRHQNSYERRLLQYSQSEADRGEHAN